MPLIFPRIDSAVSITGYHEFVVDKDAATFRI
jgi:hypothetical protein